MALWKRSWRKPRRIAPGIYRLPVGNASSSAAGSPGGLPISLTLEDVSDPAVIGVLAPAGRTPWGCLFFVILGIAILVAISSKQAALLIGILGLILYWGFYNHPRRVVADSTRRALSLLLGGQASRAAPALTPALGRAPGSDGVHYLAALLAVANERPDRALGHLDEARPEMQIFCEYHHLRGRCFKLINRPQEAAPAYEKALAFRAYPSRPLLLGELEALYREAGELAGAERIMAMIQNSTRPQGEEAQAAFRRSLQGLEAPPEDSAEK